LFYDAADELDRIFDRITSMLQQRSRVFVVRVDLLSTGTVLWRAVA